MKPARFALLALLVACWDIPLLAAEKAPRWIEMHSPHFTVVTNASEKQAERLADQFEQIRSVFQKVFPRLRVDPNAPIVIIAARDEKSFRELEPREWLEKGAAQRTGMFLRGPEKNYVTLRLDAAGERPYLSIYHEYTHLLTAQGPRPLPLWLDEGLAEFYGNTEIHEKEVWLGNPLAEHVQLLRESRLIPLPTLFTVDHSSPYYNEQTRTSIFYAESWALTHYLMVKGQREGKSLLSSFLGICDSEPDPVRAATGAFGDLRQLQRDLEGYIQQASFAYFRMKGSTEIDDSSFAVRELSRAESAAIRGDYLVSNQKYPEGKALLEEALAADPKNADAKASMGLLYFRQQDYKEAGQWFARAVEQNSQSYLAHYYFAALAMREEPNRAAEIERGLRTAIKINPNFALAYDALAAFYGQRDQNLDEAHTLALKAVSLDPGEVRYYVTTGQILLRLHRPEDAQRVGERARSVARSPEDFKAAEGFLASVREYQDYEALAKQRSDQAASAALLEQQRQIEAFKSEPTKRASEEDEPTPPVLRHRDEAGRGQGVRDVVEGRIAEVKCSVPALDMTLSDTSHQKVLLHAANYFKVEYNAANFTPSGTLNPCADIKGMRARIVYVHPKGRPNEGEIVSVELRK